MFEVSIKKYADIHKQHGSANGRTAQQTDINKKKQSLNSV